MKKKKYDDDPIVNEVRRTRAELQERYRGNMEKLSKDARKLARKFGFKYGSPKKKRTGT